MWLRSVLRLERAAANEYRLTALCLIKVKEERLPNQSKATDSPHDTPQNERKQRASL